LTTTSIEGRKVDNVVIPNKVYLWGQLEEFDVYDLKAYVELMEVKMVIR